MADLINDYSPENKSYMVPPSSSGVSSDVRVTTEYNAPGTNNKELQGNMTLFSKTVNTVETLIAPGAKRLADWWYGSSSKPKHEVKGPVPNEEVSTADRSYNTTGLILCSLRVRPLNTMCSERIGIGDVSDT